MIKIETEKDLQYLIKKSNINRLVVSFLREYLHWFFGEYDCDTLAEFGAFYFLEKREDGLKNVEMGLSLPLDRSLPEFTEILALCGSTGQIKLLHSCFVLNDSYAISVFVEPGILEPVTERYLLEDYTERTVQVDI